MNAYALSLGKFESFAFRGIIPDLLAAGHDTHLHLRTTIQRITPPNK